MSLYLVKVQNKKICCNKIKNFMREKKITM